MAIFKCIDDPTDGPFLKIHGITDAQLLKYVVDRAGSTSEAAFKRLAEGRFASPQDADRLRRLVDQFPHPE